MQALNGLTATLSLCNAYLADMISPANRAAAFGFAMASFSSGLLV